MPYTPAYSEVEIVEAIYSHLLRLFDNAEFMYPGTSPVITQEPSSTLLVKRRDGSTVEIAVREVPASDRPR